MPRHCGEAAMPRRRVALPFRSSPGHGAGCGTRRSAAGTVPPVNEPATTLPVRSTQLPVRRLFTGLAAVSVALVMVSLLLPVAVHSPLTRDRGDLRMYIWVQEEGNLPTWWSVLLLMTAAVLCGINGWWQRAGGRSGLPWWLAGSVLALLSLDELTLLHERFNRWGLEVIGGGFAFGWVVVGVPLAVGVVVVVVLTVRRLPVAAARLLVGGVGLLLASAVGGEVLGGLLLGDGPEAVDGVNPPYTVVLHLEELGEMLGAALAACAPVSAWRVGHGATGRQLALDVRGRPRHQRDVR
jgi:hypothetical protein